MAMVQAVEAWTAGVPAEDYARSHKELEAALKFWSR
jgi:ribulose 1,5-bisphosphate carboxylase large subunit-like protein